MEKLVIQANTENLPMVENFIRAICDDNHIVNYYATISVPVMKAVEKVVLSDNASEISLVFDHCHGGIYFTVLSSTPCFSSTLSAEVPPAGSPEEALYLITMLADQIEILDEGRSLQMTFELQGIDVNEASERMQALEHFYDSIHSQVPQPVEL